MLCALLLAVAGLLACLVLVLTLSSGAQAQAVARSEGAVAVAGEDCVEFEDEADEQTTEENEDTDAERTAEREIELELAQNENNATDQLSQLDNTGEATGNGADIDVGTQSQDAESGDIQQSLETGSEGDDGDSLRSEQSEDEDDGDGTNSLREEENGDATFDETDGNEGTTLDDAEDNDGEEEECVIAESVPDELLPPTGVSAKPQNDGPVQRKESDRQKKQTTRGESSSDRNEKTSDRDAEQKKTVSARSGSTKRSEPRSQQEKKSGSAEKSQSKKKVEIKDHSSGETVEVEDRSSREPRQGSLGDRSKAANTPDPAPRLAANWASPSHQEVDSASKLRRFAPNPAGSEMTLSVRALGLYDAPVASSGRPEDLDNGLVRMPQTDLPWGEGEKEKNVYVAGHYLGLEGTNSRMVFYNLHKLKKGDEIALKDGLGRAYRYRVSEKFAAGPEASWAMGDVRGRDMLTLQTCIPPDFGKRLLVRADRVRDDR